MDLSPLSQIAGMFEGAPTLSDFGGIDPVTNRVRGSARQFVEFYKKRDSEMVCIEAKKTPVPQSIVVMEKPLKYEVQPIERLMVRIITPGDKNEIDCVATDEHKREHWPQYNNFMNGVTAPVGILVTDPQISFIPSGVATEMMRLKIFTVNQFVDCSDEALRLLGPDAYAMRDTAKIWLEANENDQDKLEMRELKRKSEEQANELEQMREQMSKLLNAQGQPIERKKPGRQAVLKA